MKKKRDARELLKKAKRKNAKALLRKAKDRKKITKAKLKQSVNPYKRISWANAKRYYIYGIVASDNPHPKDNIVYTQDLITQLAQRHRSVDSFPVYYNFDTERLIGSARLNGVMRDGGRYYLLGAVTVVVPLKFAERMDKMYLGLGVSAEKSQIRRTTDQKLITGGKVISISLISKDKVCDPLCKVNQILKDADIDRRLEED